MNSNIFKRLLSSLILFPLSFYLIFEGGYLFNFFLIFCLLVSCFEWNKMVSSNIIRILGFIFILVSFLSTYKMRIIYSDENIFEFFILILICAFTDIGGFIFGKIIKGPKLTKISPNKTYSGVIGGLFFSISIVYLYSLLSKKFLFTEIGLIYIIFVSIISQLGDLVISYFKRLSNLKDTGNIIPGHGGILDRIDGMIFVFPIIYLYHFLK